MHAVARLALHPLITNIQTSWVKMGPDGAALCLNAGANDLGGTLMNESISRAAGTQHGQELPPADMDALIRADRDFDLLIVPGANHDLMNHPYVVRRKWDYFVTHLMEAVPPGGAGAAENP